MSLEIIKYHLVTAQQDIRCPLAHFQRVLVTLLEIFFFSKLPIANILWGIFWWLPIHSDTFLQIYQRFANNFWDLSKRFATLTCQEKRLLNTSEKLEIQILKTPKATRTDKNHQRFISWSRSIHPYPCSTSQYRETIPFKSVSRRKTQIYRS